MNTPKQYFVFCKFTGICLLFAFWVKRGGTTGFFLFLFMLNMSLLRWRLNRARFTVIFDMIACVVLSGDLVVLAIPVFEAMFLGYYGMAPVLVFAFLEFSLPVTSIFSLSAMSGFFLGRWAHECDKSRLIRDTQAGRYYELESLQNDLAASLAQIEQMTALAERARIARDIHDNAGHEIVSAYITFQTIQDLLPVNDTELLELYDTALERFGEGVEKMREAVHNLSSANFSGAKKLRDKCRNFPGHDIDFRVFGDTSRVPIYVWNMLDSCLSEALTNIARHAAATWVTVELDVAAHIVRLCVTNNGAVHGGSITGTGLQNLRHRAAALGGSISVDAGKIFSVICVVPICAQRIKETYESSDS